MAIPGVAASFLGKVALSSFAFDRNLETSKEIARGAQQTRLINTVVGGVVDFVFS